MKGAVSDSLPIFLAKQCNATIGLNSFLIPFYRFTELGIGELDAVVRSVAPTATRRPYNALFYLSHLAFLLFVRTGIFNANVYDVDNSLGLYVAGSRRRCWCWCRIWVFIAQTSALTLSICQFEPHDAERVTVCTCDSRARRCKQ